MSEAKSAHDDGRTAPVNGSDRPAVEPSPAASKPLAGDRLCRACAGHGEVYLFFMGANYTEVCDRCQGTGVEPDSSAASERLAVPTARPNNPIAEGVAGRAADRADWQSLTVGFLIGLLWGLLFGGLGR